MNKSILIGRLTKDPELTYTNTGTAIARFSLAVDRQTKDKGADFINIVVFNKQAENCNKYLHKGQKTAIEGHIHTGSYDKDGRKVYTTEVVADRVEFIEWANDDNNNQATMNSGQATQSNEPSWMDSFSEAEDDIPF